MLRTSARHALRKIIYEVAAASSTTRRSRRSSLVGRPTPFLVPENLDVNMDFDSVAKLGSFLGSGRTVIIDEDTCMVQVALRIIAFTPMKVRMCIPAAKHHVVEVRC